MYLHRDLGTKRQNPVVTAGEYSIALWLLQGNIWAKITNLEFESQKNIVFSIFLSTERAGRNICEMVLLLRYFSVCPNSLGRKEKKLYKAHIVHCSVLEDKHRVWVASRCQNWAISLRGITYTILGRCERVWKIQVKATCKALLIKIPTLSLRCILVLPTPSNQGGTFLQGGA